MFSFNSQSRESILPKISCSLSWNLASTVVNSARAFSASASACLRRCSASDSFAWPAFHPTMAERWCDAATHTHTHGEWPRVVSHLQFLNGGRALGLALLECCDEDDCRKGDDDCKGKCDEEDGGKS